MRLTHNMLRYTQNDIIQIRTEHYERGKQDATKTIRAFFKLYESYFVDDSGDAYPHKLLFHEMWQALKTDAKASS